MVLTHANALALVLSVSAFCSPARSSLHSDESAPLPLPLVVPRGMHAHLHRLHHKRADPDESSAVSDVQLPSVATQSTVSLQTTVSLSARATGVFDAVPSSGVAVTTSMSTGLSLATAVSPLGARDPAHELRGLVPSSVHTSSAIHTTVSALRRRMSTDLYTFDDQSTTATGTYSTDYPDETNVLRRAPMSAKDFTFYNKSTTTDEPSSTDFGEIHTAVPRQISTDISFTSHIAASTSVSMSGALNRTAALEARPTSSASFSSSTSASTSESVSTGTIVSPSTGAPVLLAPRATSSLSSSSAPASTGLPTENVLNKTALLFALISAHGNSSSSVTPSSTSSSSSPASSGTVSPASAAFNKTAVLLEIVRLANLSSVALPSSNSSSVPALPVTPPSTNSSLSVSPSPSTSSTSISSTASATSDSASSTVLPVSPSVNARAVRQKSRLLSPSTSDSDSDSDSDSEPAAAANNTRLSSPHLNARAVASLHARGLRKLLPYATVHASEDPSKAPSKTEAAPSLFPTVHVRDTAADNIVYVTNQDQFCMIMPRQAHTDIGDSEHPGGEKTYCSRHGKYAKEQGEIPDGFWRNVAFESGKGKHGGKYAQLTGCIRPEKLDRLNPSDYGGQYDSSGGRNGQGNPQGSVCLGYKHYVELVEPAGPRACIKCCDDPVDCPTNKDTQGCPVVIPGEYFSCG